MYLDKLEIKGFKSFVKKTTFTFKEPYTAVVGPNGGGKTNVVDALRWVMGEQSMKLLRCKKAEDVIFAGSQKLTRLGLAQVDLYLKNEDKRLPIDYREVVISRRLHRKGESEYFINKNSVRLQDVIMLLAKANFGQKSYGIIGQGMVTNILQANPQDRKEFFDEATGVKKHQIKRNQAINKLMRTENNLKRAEDLLGEIEPHLRSLSRQVNKLEKRKKIEVELTEKQLKYYGSFWKDLTDRLRIVKQKEDEGKLRVQKAEREVASLQRDIDVFGQEKSREEIYQKLQSEYQDISLEKNKLVKEQIVLKGELELEEKKQGELDLVWMEKRKEEIVEIINKTWLEIKDLERTAKNLEEKLNNTIREQEVAADLFRELEYQSLKTKEELEKEIEVVAMPEVREELKDLFMKQEAFLKRLLGTDSLDRFREVQKDAQRITTQLAELLDRLYQERSEEIAAKKAKLNQLSKKIKEALTVKEKLLQNVNDQRLNIQVKKEKINLLLDKNKKETAEKEQLEKSIQRTREKWEQKLGTAEKLKEWQAKNKALETKITNLENELKEKQARIEAFNQAEEKKKNSLFKLQNEIKLAQTRLNQFKEEVNHQEIERAKLETKQVDLKAEMFREISEELNSACKKYTQLHGNLDGLLVEIESLKHQLELIGGIDPETIKEHEEVKERRDFLKNQSKDLNRTMLSLEKLIDQLDEKIKKQFDTAFKEINKNFIKYFDIIFEGGKAKLTLLRENPTPTPEEVSTEANEEAQQPEPLSLGKRKKKMQIVSGVDIEASPPGKKVKNIQALSGGEKSMTALALICAIIAVNAPPFVILDEVEAALDETNSEKFGAILKRLSKKTQFIVITHNRATMHQADVLYGVTMDQEGASNILSVKIGEAEEMINK